MNTGALGNKNAINAATSTLIRLMCLQIPKNTTFILLIPSEQLYCEHLSNLPARLVTTLCNKVTLCKN